MKFNHQKIQVAALIATCISIAACGKKEPPMGEPVPMPVTEVRGTPIVPADDATKQKIIDEQAAQAIVPPVSNITNQESGAQK
mgnify:CR=1 FL=1